MQRFAGVVPGYLLLCLVSSLMQLQNCHAASTACKFKLLLIALADKLHLGCGCCTRICVHIVRIRTAVVHEPVHLSLLVWHDRFGLVHATEGLDNEAILRCTGGQHTDTNNMKCHLTIQNMT